MYVCVGGGIVGCSVWSVCLSECGMYDGACGVSLSVWVVVDLGVWVSWSVTNHWLTNQIYFDVNFWCIVRVYVCGVCGGRGVWRSQISAVYYIYIYLLIFKKCVYFVCVVCVSVRVVCREEGITNHCCALYSNVKVVCVSGGGGEVPSH